MRTCIGCCNANTLADIRMWMKNVEQHTGESVSKILVGNKSDDEERRVRPIHLHPIAHIDP